MSVCTNMLISHMLTKQLGRGVEAMSPKLINQKPMIRAQMQSFRLAQNIYTGLSIHSFSQRANTAKCYPLFTIKISSLSHVM